LARIIGLALVVVAAVVGVTSVANAEQVRQPGSLVIGVDGCAATVVVPADRFDPGAPVLVSTARWDAVVAPGAPVVVQLDGTTEIRAAGMRDGKPDEVIDTASCSR